LKTTFPEITPATLAESSARIEKQLTAKQLRLLDVRFSERASRTGATVFETALAAANLPDPAPNPEVQAVLRERATALRKALTHLPPREQLMIRLRFERDLTLEQVAKLLDLGNAQRAERQIRTVLAKLRRELE